MIYFILALFFTSLIGILIMVGRKIALLKDGNYEFHDEVNFEVPYAKEIKHTTINNLKKIEHNTLVFIVKSYIQFSNFSKNTYIDLKNKVKNIDIKHYTGPDSVANTEISKILKVVSTYKYKITEITHKIKEEEKKM